MTETPRQANGDVDGDLADVHHFGAASESLFRRLYRGLGRRRQLERELARQRQVARRHTAESASLRRRYERLESDDRRRRSELDRLTKVLSSLEDGVIVQDVNGKVTMMNPAAQTLLGGKRAFWDSKLGAMFERHRDIRAVAAELTPLGAAAELPLNNRVVRARLVAIGDDGGRRIGTVVILADVTQQALADRLREGFAAHIARDMERPISVIKLASELLSGQPEDAAVNERLLEKLLGNVDRLDQLSLELLDLSRMEARALAVKREPASVEDVIWSVVKSVEGDIRVRGIDLLVMTRDLRGVGLRGDDRRLQWALAHLVRNGAAFSQDGGYVALAARLEARHGKTYALISVSDNGDGIRPEVLPQIFERAYRGSADPEGAGLGQGMYIARAICQAHGGFLEVESRFGIGSVFTMGLPVRQPAVEVA